MKVNSSKVTADEGKHSVSSHPDGRLNWRVAVGILKRPAGHCRVIKRDRDACILEIVSVLNYEPITLEQDGRKESSSKNTKRT